MNTDDHKRFIYVINSRFRWHFGTVVLLSTRLRLSTVEGLLCRHHRETGKCLNWIWPLTGMILDEEENSNCQGFVKATVSRAVRVITRELRLLYICIWL